MDSGSRTVKLTRADEQWAEKVYRRKWRQIRRWLEKGEASGEPCPLFDPAKLLTWWPHHSKWRVPIEIEEAAVAQAKGALLPRDESIGAPPSSTPPAANPPEPRSRQAKQDPPPP